MECVLRSGRVLKGYYGTRTLERIRVGAPGYQGERGCLVPFKPVQGVQVVPASHARVCYCAESERREIVGKQNSGHRSAFKRRKERRSAVVVVVVPRSVSALDPEYLVLTCFRLFHTRFSATVIISFQYLRVPSVEEHTACSVVVALKQVKVSLRKFRHLRCRELHGHHLQQVKTANTGHEAFQFYCLHQPLSPKSV